MTPDETPAETPATPLPLPTEGGSYERLSDGSLRRLPDEATETPEPAPARKTKAKE